MIDPITLSMIRDVITIFGVIAGFSYYVLTVRNSRKTQKHQLETRQAQLFMQMYNRWNTLEMRTQFDLVMASEWKDYDDFVDYSRDREYMTGFYIVAGFIEGIGVLVNKGLIEAGLVDDLLSGSLMRYWEKLEPVVFEIRARRNWPQYGEWGEYLYCQIKSIYEQQHPELEINP